MDFFAGLLSNLNSLDLALLPDLFSLKSGNVVWCGVEQKREYEDKGVECGERERGVWFFFPFLPWKSLTLRTVYSFTW